MTDPFWPLNSQDDVNGYVALPYQFDRYERPSAARIPVTGPKPFNTLAVVNTICGTTFQPPGATWADGTLKRGTFTIRTPFRLAGYDPRRPEQQNVAHSSCGVLRTLDMREEPGLFNDGNADFVIAIDGIHTHSSFDDDGHWLLTIDVAWLSTADAVHLAQITSYVLCWEPALA